MKKILVYALLVFFTTAASFAQTSTEATAVLTDAKAVLQASYQKTGGDKWKEVASLKTTGTMTVGTPMGDLEGTFTSHAKFPGYGRQDITIGTPMGEVVIQNVVTPTKGWMSQSFNGEENKVDMEEAQLAEGKVQSANEELDILNNTEATLSMKEDTFDGKAVYAVTITKGEATKTRFYDKTSLFCVGTKSEQEDSIIGNYKMVGDVMLPHAIKRTIHAEQGDQEISLTTKTAEVNVTVADSVFEDS